ncbi:MAG: hypothetical protein LAP87_02205 [Acidobacteriia bacterium]|nr:hypothetical protein [Terriglobia bacterium]
MEAVGALLRFFSYLFHGLLALFLLAVSGLALASGTPSLRLDMLPWKGATLTLVVFFSALLALIALVLALRRKLRALFFLWALAVPVLLFKGYIFSGYRFVPGEARWAACLLLASLIALGGAWSQLWRPRRRRY